MPKRKSADWSFGSSFWLKPHHDESALVSGFGSLKGHENWRALAKPLRTVFHCIRGYSPRVCWDFPKLPTWFLETGSYFALVFHLFTSVVLKVWSKDEGDPRDPFGRSTSQN